MATRKTVAKKVSSAKTVTTIDISPEPATLKSFGKGDHDHPGFSFTRYWWVGDGPREGITPWVEKKLRPGDDPVFGYAARAEVLLPPTAPADYADMAFLLRRFDETRPPYETHAMVQVKLALDPDEPWHVGYERVRSYARAHFAGRFPVILVAHIPGTAGLEGYGNHVHCIVLPRPIMRIDPTLMANVLLSAPARLRADLTAPADWLREEAALELARLVADRIEGGLSEPANAGQMRLAL